MSEAKENIAKSAKQISQIDDITEAGFGQVGSYASNLMSKDSPVIYDSLKGNSKFN